MTQRKHTAKIKCAGCGREFGIIQSSHIVRCDALARIGIKTRSAYKEKFGSVFAPGIEKILAGNISAFNKSLTPEQRSDHAFQSYKKAIEKHPDLGRKGGLNGSKGLWSKPGQKERHKARLVKMNSCGFMTQKPNKLEKKFWDLVGNENLDFVSFNFWKTIKNNDSFINITPDFRVKGVMAVIEVYGDYWHRNDNPQERIDAWSSVGVDCLVIWENEINKHPEFTKEKTLEYISRKLHERLAPHN